jgi:hypothetical protein
MKPPAFLTVALAGSFAGALVHSVSPAVAADAPAAPTGPPPPPVTVSVANPLGVARAGETVAIARPDLLKVAPGLDITKAVVVDAHGAPILSQLVDTDGDDVPDQLVFQTDLGPRETRKLEVRAGVRTLAAPADYRVYGRFVRERHDDFAWENDRIAHRVYGPDLETWKKEPLVSSGVDVWVKRVPKLVVNEWYMTDDYHQDHGEGADFYSVGKSRGCGGLGVWSAGKLQVSRNFTASRVLANGPIRLVFELTYAPWDAGGGAHVAETRRVTLDAGSQFNRFESTFTSTAAGGAPSIGIGIAKHPGGEVKADAKSTFIRSWEPAAGGAAGHIGCAIVLGPGARFAEQPHLDGDELVVTRAPAAAPLVYYVGTAWDKGGRIADAAAWTKEAEGLSARLAAPVKVSLAVAASRK